jgi:hypothetical protein
MRLKHVLQDVLDLFQGLPDGGAVFGTNITSVNYAEVDIFKTNFV